MNTVYVKQRSRPKNQGFYGCSPCIVYHWSTSWQYNCVLCVLKFLKQQAHACKHNNCTWSDFSSSNSLKLYTLYLKIYTLSNKMPVLLDWQGLNKRGPSGLWNAHLRNKCLYYIPDLSALKFGTLSIMSINRLRGVFFLYLSTFPAANLFYVWLTWCVLYDTRIIQNLNLNA